MTIKCVVIAIFGFISMAFSSEKTSCVPRLDNDIRKIHGSLFVCKGQQARMAFYNYLIQKQNWTDDCVTMHPANYNKLNWHSRNLTSVISSEMNEKVCELINEGNVVKLVPITPRNPIYSTEKKLLNQPVFFKWQIVPTVAKYTEY